MLTQSQAMMFMASENKDRGDALVHEIGHTCALLLNFLAAKQMRLVGHPARSFHVSQAEIDAELCMSPNTQRSCILKLNNLTTINKDDPSETPLISLELIGRPHKAHYTVNADKYNILLCAGVAKKLLKLQNLREPNESAEVAGADLTNPRNQDSCGVNKGIHPSSSASSSLKETLMPSSRDSSQCPGVTTTDSNTVVDQEKHTARQGVRQMQERMKQEAQVRATNKRNAAMDQAVKKQPAVQHLIDYAAKRKMLMPGATGAANRVKPDTIKFIIDTLYAMVKQKPITMWRDAELTTQTLFTENDFKHAVDNYYLAATSPDFHPISPKSKQFLLSVRLAEFLYYPIHNESKFLQFLAEPKRRVEDADAAMTKYLTDAFMHAKGLPKDVPLNHKDIKNLTEAANKLAKYREDHTRNIVSVDAVGPMLARMAVEVVTDYFNRKGEDWELQDLKAPWITNGALTRKLKEKGAWQERAIQQSSFRPDEEMRAAREGHFGV